MDRLICGTCGLSHAMNQPRWKCTCGGLLDLRFNARFDLDAIASRPPNMWRYREAIPVNDDAHVISFDEGFTPLVEVEIGGRSILVKQDHLFPTGSYKDRGASVLVSKISELGITQVVEDSSGNAGCAVAAYSSRAGIDCGIYLPEETSEGKVAQVGLYGARIHRIPGSREDTARAVLEAAEDTYYASHSWNPFFFHGTKTFAFEVCEQLGWQAPDAVVLPVGNGTLLLGAWIGFNELKTAGVIQRIPRLIAVQSVNCAPLAVAFRENLTEIPQVEKKDSVAEGIAIAEPIRGQQILEAVRGSDGEFVTVSDTEILTALRQTCAMGFYIEPTSAATVAGIEKYLGQSAREETIVSVFTGHGLKATKTMSNL